MKTFLFITLLFLPLEIFAQNIDKEFNPLNPQLRKQFDSVTHQLRYKINNLEDRLEFQEKINERTISSISSQLDAASYTLTLFGGLFAIAAIVLSVYVTYIERKIVKISEENRDLFIRSQRIKEDVESTNNLIQKDIYTLFLKIKREETVHILDSW